MHPVLAILKVLFRFVLAASDPHATCALAHRDAGIAGTYYLYCVQTTDRIEVISVGYFVPDDKRLPAARGAR